MDEEDKNTGASSRRPTGESSPVISNKTDLTTSYKILEEVADYLHAIRKIGLAQIFVDVPLAKEHNILFDDFLRQYQDPSLRIWMKDNEMAFKHYSPMFKYNAVDAACARIVYDLANEVVREWNEGFMCEGATEDQTAELHARFCNMTIKPRQPCVWLFKDGDGAEK